MLQSGSRSSETKTDTSHRPRPVARVLEHWGAERRSTPLEKTDMLTNIENSKRIAGDTRTGNRLLDAGKRDLA